MRLGPEHPRSWWDENNKDGDCPDCGGQCSPECGKHPAGCFFGGLGGGYWMIAEGCQLFHGEVKQ
jgi:hypothetical protein